jgi:hypothetical protein
METTPAADLPTPETPIPQSPLPATPPAAPTPAPLDTRSDRRRNASIVVHMWPKTLVLYPVALVALVGAFVGFFFGAYPHEADVKRIVVERAELIKQGKDTERTDPDRMVELAGKIIQGKKVDKAIGWVFFVVLAVALFALCIETEIRWAMMGFVGLVAIGLGLVLANQQLHFLPKFVGQLFALEPSATPQFYAGIFLVWVVLFVITLFVIRFHYVRIEPNEVFVVYGMLEGQRRFSTLQMKYEKDVTDVLEYYLPFVNSGKLILTFPGQERIVLENVRGIDAVISRLNRLTSQFNVGVGLRQ